MTSVRLPPWDWGGLAAGYYSPSEDWLVFSDCESHKNIAEARRGLEEVSAEIEAIKRASRRASMVGRRDEAWEIASGLDERLDDFTEQERRLNLQVRQQTISVIVHEAIHQLMFHTRVQVPGVDQPRWLTEELATAFETEIPQGRRSAPATSTSRDGGSSRICSRIRSCFPCAIW